jgi:hypothetical protein
MNNSTHLKLAVIAMLAFTSNAHAQVTVFDAPNEVHFAATVETLKTELEQVRTLTASINGLREFSTELKTLSVSNVLPPNLLALYGSMSSSSNFRASAPCVTRDASSEALCQLDAAKTSTDQQLAAALYSQAPTRQIELNALQSALLGAPDLKTSADLNTRTGLANASLENQRLQVELFQLQSALQDQSIAKARRWDQLSRVTTSTRAIDSLVPMTFGAP